MSNTKERPTLLIVDDHPSVADAHALSFEAEFTIVGTASDANSGLAIARDLVPCLVLMDVVMAGKCPFAATREITSQTSAKVLLWTGSDRENYLDRALHAGASGLVAKGSETIPELCSILRRALKGGFYVSRPWESRLNELEAGAPQNPLALITETQVYAMRMIAEGASRREIAKALEVTQRELAKELSGCRELLGAKTDLRLIYRAMAEGILLEEHLRP